MLPGGEVKMKTLFLVTVVLLTVTSHFLFASNGAVQDVKSPYILGRNDVRIKCKNFLMGRKPRYGSTYLLQAAKSGVPSIEFDKKTNEFEVVTGAENSSRSIELAKQELRGAERILVAITGVAPADKCKLKVLMRIVIPGSIDGGVHFDHLPSCGEF
jgi:hypothetical protein